MKNVCWPRDFGYLEVLFKFHSNVSTATRLAIQNSVHAWVGVAKRPVESRPAGSNDHRSFVLFVEHGTNPDAIVHMLLKLPEIESAVALPGLESMAAVKDE